MKVSTEYLFTEPLLVPAIPPVEISSTVVSQNATPLMQPQPDTADVPVTQLSEAPTPNNIEVVLSESASVKAEDNGADVAVASNAQDADGANSTIDVENDVEDTKAPLEAFISPNLPPVIPDSDVQISQPAPELRQQASFMSSVPMNGHSNIDVFFEASKLPLDVAIVNSPRGTQQDDKVRKYLQAVLVIGGTARLPGMVHALESRLVTFLFFFHIAYLWMIKMYYISHISALS